MPPSTLRALEDVILDGQRHFADLLAHSLATQRPSRDQYARYLSFQYHLTRDVQSDLLAIAGHRELARRRKLREFLFRFANEEELHYLVAAKDLAALGLAPLPISIDVELWHAYFWSILRERPFVRLGAAAVIENISGGPARDWLEKALRGDFLDRSNSNFIVLQRQASPPPGRQVLDALAGGSLKPRHFADLVEGAHKATVLYLRMVEWALRPESVSRICDASAATIGAIEARRIAEFDVHELVA